MGDASCKLSCNSDNCRPCHDPIVETLNIESHNIHHQDQDQILPHALVQWQDSFTNQENRYHPQTTVVPVRSAAAVLRRRPRNVKEQALTMVEPKLQMAAAQARIEFNIYEDAQDVGHNRHDENEVWKQAEIMLQELEHWKKDDFRDDQECYHKEDEEMRRQFIEEPRHTDDENHGISFRSASIEEDDVREAPQCEVTFVCSKSKHPEPISIVFKQRPLGIEFDRPFVGASKVRVKKFKKQSYASKLGVQKGWLLMAVNGNDVSKMSFDKAVSALNQAVLSLPEFK